MRDESADSQPVAAAQSVNDISPGYRIVHDDETLELMQELAQYSDEYDTIDHTTTSSDTATTSLDSHAVVNRVINLTSATDVSTPVLLSKMHYRDVLIQELSRDAVALEDSGAEISIIPSSLVRDLNLVSLGKINLSGIIGDPVQANLVQLHIKPATRSVTVDEYKNCSEHTDNIAPSISVFFAVCDKLSGKHDLILTADVIEQLNHLNSYTVNTIVSDSGSSGPSQLNATITNRQDSNTADSTDDVDVTTVPTNDDVKTTNASIDVDDENNGGRADT